MTTPEERDAIEWEEWRALLARFAPGQRIYTAEHGIGTVQAVHRITATVHFDDITRYGVHTLEPRLADLVDLDEAEDLAADAAEQRRERD